MAGEVAEAPATAPSSPGGRPSRVGGHAGDTPTCPWVGLRGGGAHGREWVHACASEDTPRTRRRQLIMIIYNYQTLRAKRSIPFILYNDSEKSMPQNSSGVGC